MFSCNLPPALLTEWPGSFTCYCGNTGVERIPKLESAQKVDPGEENSPAAPTGIWTRDLSVSSPAFIDNTSHSFAWMVEMFCFSPYRSTGLSVLLFYHELSCWIFRLIDCVCCCFTRSWCAGFFAWLIACAVVLPWVDVLDISLDWLCVLLFYHELICWNFRLTDCVCCRFTMSWCAAFLAWLIVSTALLDFWLDWLCVPLFIVRWCAGSLQQFSITCSSPFTAGLSLILFTSSLR